MKAEPKATIAQVEELRNQLNRAQSQLAEISVNQATNRTRLRLFRDVNNLVLGLLDECSIDEAGALLADAMAHAKVLLDPDYETTKMVNCLWGEK